MRLTYAAGVLETMGLHGEPTRSSVSKPQTNSEISVASPGVLRRLVLVGGIEGILILYSHIDISGWHIRDNGITRGTRKVERLRFPN